MSRPFPKRGGRAWRTRWRRDSKWFHLVATLPATTPQGGRLAVRADAIPDDARRPRVIEEELDTPPREVLDKLVVGGAAGERRHSAQRQGTRQPQQGLQDRATAQEIPVVPNRRLCGFTLLAHCSSTFVLAITTLIGRYRAETHMRAERPTSHHLGMDDAG